MRVFCFFQLTGQLFCYCCGDTSFSQFSTAAYSAVPSYYSHFLQCIYLVVTPVHYKQHRLDSNIRTMCLFSCHQLPSWLKMTWMHLITSLIRNLGLMNMYNSSAPYIYCIYHLSEVEAVIFKQSDYYD